MEHIIVRHGDDFAKWGVDSSSISTLVTNTVKTGQSIGKYGADGSVFKVIVNGEEKYLNVVIGKNGYIVTSHPLKMEELTRVLWR
ncbi:hypothetical protein [Sulfurospirillum halorespirans]|uniref:Uncharacterized protein n=1 Tax=Sulfurospirillum halorespirans DSM 13726 TaxID=1193502 RepID=A0A1D7TKS0_9BACT|nr:hypothetical protein [Sulfurospirillum halorespirans]AOO65595.1 hypothetical protein SHALO_1824 [Sulfurospirillum halorespirans DSM 13726]